MAEFSFTVCAPWFVALAGYTVQRQKVVEVAPGAQADPGSYRSYEAMDAAGMFLDFTRIGIERTEVDILRFANRYGSLRKPEHDEIPVRDWVAEAEQLGDFVREGMARPGKWSGLSEDLLDSVGSKMASLGVFVSAAPELVVSSRSLLSTMYLQAGMAMVKKTTFVRCTQCGRHIPLHPKMRPGGPYYCGDTCRVQSYRDRKASAVEMVVNEGVPVAVAASKLGSAESTVAGWIGAAKRKSGLSLDVTTAEEDAPKPKKGKKQ